MKVRTRIAPSPTGFPHVGTAYIALFNLCFAKQHGGGTQLGFAKRHHRKFKGESACFINPSLDEFGQFSKVTVAGGQLTPGVTDANDRSAIELVVRVALVFQPASVDKSVSVLFAKPGLTAA